ncbi:leucine-rich repeat protein [Bacteroides salyersiae]|nr:leucine-rich repeat protein [Bacteroides salyersiae]WMS09845.1 leucine-rich repeat protein [Bacteroides salyersiae]
MKAIAEGTFTMEMIENWTGEGENKAALAIQWNAEGETNALVWGYRWDGEATGEKMIRDIAAADPRFFCMTETGTAYGSTIAGLGYDVNKSGDFAVQKDGKIYYPDEEGVIFTGGYGYDGFTCLDPEDYWQSGWYQGYWSYWLKSSDESAWGYSGVGATGRKLTDGCWDGWNFAVNMSSQPWKEMAPAAKNGPTAPSIKIQPESIVVSPGESATFAPEFKGDTLVYQWYKNEIAIPDAKTPHYTIPSVTVEDAGSYYCIVKNILDEISTDTVTLTVGNKNITAIPGSEPNTAIVTYDDSYITYSGLLTIPSTIKLNGSDYSIIGIDNMAFKGCNKLTSIILPDNLTTLGEKAFSGCTALSSIILPNEVEQIGDETFSGCSALTSITVNDKLKSIGRAAFENCIALTDIILPDNVETIGSSTFKNCEKLSSVILGNSITELGDSTFLGCSTLKNIILPSSLQKIGVRSFNGCSSLINVELGHINSIGDVAFNGCTALTSITFPNNLTSIGNYAFSGCTELSSITFEEEKLNQSTLELSSMTIGNYAFEGCTKINTLTIPDKVTTLGNYAFNKCEALTSVSFGNGLVSIGNYAFGDCKKLTTVTFGTSLETIGERAFSNTQLPSLTLPSTTKIIGDWAFYGCPLNSIEFNNGLQTIGSRAFYGVSVESLNIPNSVTSLGSYAFSNCKNLSSVVLGTGITKIEDYTFNSCSSLSNIECPSVTEIGASAFASCSILKDIPLNENITTLGNGAFKSCKAITSVTVPNSVTDMGTSIFDGCTELLSATLGTGVFSVPNYTFNNCSKLATIVLSENITSIGQYAFQNCTSLAALPLTANITQINNYAFKGCTKLTSIEVPDQITSLGTYVFQNCTGITHAKIGSGITTLSNYTFYGCSNLEKVELSEKITSIGSYAFYNCQGLKILPITNAITTIGANAFYGCKGLTSAVLSDNITSLGGSAFYNCSSLEEVTLGSGITKLESSLFRNNSQLKKVVANGIITSLATYTFNGCSALECIYIKSESVPTASSNTFTNVPETCIIFVPETSVNAYKEANYWKNFIISPWLSSLEIVSTTPSMDFGNGEEANIDKDTKTFTITFNRNIVEKDNISATLKFEDELVNDQVLTVSYADNVLTLNREGERLPAGKYTLVLTTSESVLNITFNVEPWLPELEIVSTTPSMDFGNGEEANIDKDTKTFTITFNRNIVEEDNISATLKLEDEVVNDQVLTASYADNVLTLNREGERLPAGKYTLVLTTSESVLNITFNVEPWLPELEIVSTTPSMDFGNGEEANIDKDTKTFTITFNRNIVEEDNISATLKFEDEVVNDQVLTASYADNVLTLNREGERLSAGKYTLVLTTSESVLNITFNVEPWLPELEIVSTTPSMDFGNGEEANIDKDTKTFTITFNRNIVEEDNISATLKFEDEVVNDQVLTASYADNVLTLNREGERLSAGKYTLVLTTSESVLNITFNVINGGVGIENQSSEKIVHTKEYYTINGTALPQPIPGFNIIKITYEDGTVEVSKIYIRSSVNQ